MASAMVDVKYDEELVKCIQQLFVNKIVPENFLLAVHKYDINVLTMADIQRLRKGLDSKSALEVNYDLLAMIKNYKGWFEVILNVCQDSEVKQSYLVPELQRLKSELDAKWFPPQEKKKDQFSSPIELQLASKLKDLSLTFKKDFDADGGAICSPPAKKSDLVNKSDTSTKDQKGAKEGWSMSNGKGICYACNVDLTSEKLKDSHITGKAHLKKMKDGGFRTPFDELPSLEATPAVPDNDCSITEDEIKDCNAPDNDCSINDGGNQESNIPDNDCSINGDWIKECKICDLTFTSAPHSRQHMEGKSHKKKIEALDVKPLKPSPKLGPTGEVYSVNEHGVGMCYLCNVSITSKENCNQHVSGRKHQNMCKDNGL